jgi:hypothetical protein
LDEPTGPARSGRPDDRLRKSCLRRTIQRGVDRGEIRNPSIVNSPQVVIAPIALVDLWMMLFGDRQPLDLKAYFDAHLDLVLNGLLTK